MTHKPTVAVPLAPDSLRVTVDMPRPEAAPPDPDGGLIPPIGQSRAVDALELAITSKHRDFNVFVQGTQGTGRHTTVRALLARHAGEKPMPDDWVYVNNFEMPHKPRALRLPRGAGVRLKKAMEDLVDDLANDIPALFESDEYQSRRHAVEQGYSEKQETSLAALNAEAKENGTAILRTPMGMAVAAIKDGEVIAPKDFEALPQADQQSIKSAVEMMQKKLEAVMKELPKIERGRRREVRKLNAEMVARGVEDTISEIMGDLAGIAAADAYIADVRADLIDNADLFLMSSPEDEDGNFPTSTSKHYEQPHFQRYMVNVMVSHTPEEGTGAPVIFEDFPTLANLIGRVEHIQEMGALVTNFTMIKPGALHLANGGYLVLDARQVLSEPFAWETLKRCLSSQAISIISVSEKLSLVSTTSLEPDPIPLDVRIVLVGDRFLYYLLMALDPDFRKLFKIQADFNDQIARDDGSLRQLAGLVGSITQHCGLKPVETAATARLLEESIRLAGDTERFSLNIDRLSDILKEADQIAQHGARDAIEARDIDAAIAAAETRASRIRELSQDQIVRGSMKIATDGAVVGQINALSVLEIGGFRFGRPSRVTARVRMGNGKIVDIEREVELGGALHSKGVMILSGYLGATYARDVPMSLWASIVFEQSYGGIDGDSASAAELFALLSGLSEQPIDQSFAVTGSVNQFGEIQAIGGVNEKIEGFFDICAARGLTGRQGVLIPRSNVKNLALRGRVVDAVAADKFRVVPIETIDQGIALLTGCEAGTRGDDDTFPADSINGRVEARLRGFAERRRKFGATDKPGKDPQ